jgi:hypothetical protein
MNVDARTARERVLVERGLAAGMTREAIIADLVIDHDVIDRMKHAGRLGLTIFDQPERPPPDEIMERSRESWTLAEMIHVATFGQRTMTRAQLVAMFEHALDLAGVS